MLKNLGFNSLVLIQILSFTIILLTYSMSLTVSGLSRSAIEAYEALTISTIPRGIQLRGRSSRPQEMGINSKRYRGHEVSKADSGTHIQNNPVFSLYTHKEPSRYQISSKMSSKTITQLYR
jgi:hypothetical protein